MITYHPKENIFESDADVLINTVNVVGVMGKGLALEFKKRYPKNFKKYKIACGNGQMTNKDVLFSDPEADIILSRKKPYQPKKIVCNFATKKHWRNKSRYEYIVDGMRSLLKKVEENKSFYTSYAIPALGCSNGGLDKAWVKPIVVGIIEESGLLEEIEFKLYF